MEKDYSDNKVLLAALLNQDSGAYKFMLSEYLQIADTIVGSRGGTEEDVKDILSEGVGSIFELARQGKLNNSATISTLFYSMCYNKWSKVLRRKATEKKNIGKIPNAQEWSIDDELERNIYRKIARQCFHKLKQECQTIIDHINNGLTYERIANRLKKTERAVRQRYYLCFHEWLQLVKEHPGYLENNSHDMS